MKFSFLIVNFNGEKTGVLNKCLESINLKKPKDSQIIIFDNGSTDNSIKLIKSYAFEDLVLIKNKTNIGPSKARSEALKFIKNEITLIMDNDAYLKKIDFKKIAEIYKRQKKLAIIQPLIIINGTDQVDYFGDYLTWTGFLKQKHEPLISFNNMDDGFILSAKSAAMIIRTSALKDVGGFDPFYFIYVEETDLGWKCWLKNYYNITQKQILFYHGYGSTRSILSKKKANKNSYFYGPRNYLIMLFTNLETKNLLIIFPIHLFLWIGFSVYCLIFKFEYSRFYFQICGIMDFIINIKTVLLKRKKIQNSRKVLDKEIFKKIMTNIPLNDFIKKATRRPKVGNLKY